MKILSSVVTWCEFENCKTDAVILRVLTDIWAVPPSSGYKTKYWSWLLCSYRSFELWCETPAKDTPVLDFVIKGKLVLSLKFWCVAWLSHIMACCWFLLKEMPLFLFWVLIGMRKARCLNVYWILLICALIEKLYAETLYIGT